MKNLLKFLLLVSLAAYLVLAVTVFNSPEIKQRCSGVDISVRDSDMANFITSREVCSILKSSGLYPLGRRMGEIDPGKIERTLTENSFIDEAFVYKTAGGHVNISISQRLPVMRVISTYGGNYYIDTRGAVMANALYPADLVVATGYITRKYAHSHLAAIGKFLRYDKFWDSQIEQIRVDSCGNISLYPRVGAQVINLGQPVDLLAKLNNLKNLYAKVMPVVGWNKYSNIDLEYENQIICKNRP